jgi:hypothetical protein
MKHLLASVYQDCSNKSPEVKIILVHGEFLYTDERFQGHHGPLVYVFHSFLLKYHLRSLHNNNDAYFEKKKLYTFFVTGISP